MAASFTTTKDPSSISVQTDSRPTLGLSKKKGGIFYHVRFPSGEVSEFIVEKSTSGAQFVADVCEHLSLREVQFFGLRFKDVDGEYSWLDTSKAVRSQTKAPLEFLVRYYPLKPSDIGDDTTRYFLRCQVHQDLLNGSLSASQSTLAWLGSLVVQSEYGDFEPALHNGNYTADVQMEPNQSVRLTQEIMMMHREQRGKTPEQCDVEFLETASKLPFYGLEVHPALGVSKDEAPIDVGVCGKGVSVLQGKLCLNRYTWPNVLRLAYRRKTFILTVKSQVVDTRGYSDEVVFRCRNEKAAEKLWKACVDHHTFFRVHRTKGDQNTSTKVRHPQNRTPRLEAAEVGSEAANRFKGAFNSHQDIATQMNRSAVNDPTKSESSPSDYDRQQEPLLGTGRSTDAVSLHPSVKLERPKLLSDVGSDDDKSFIEAVRTVTSNLNHDAIASPGSADAFEFFSQTHVKDRLLRNSAEEQESQVQGGQPVEVWWRFRESHEPPHGSDHDDI